MINDPPALIPGAVALALYAAGIGGAFAHGDHSWIQDRGFRNSRGIGCCGARDCFDLPRENLMPTAGGWAVVWEGRTYFVPEADAIHYTPDGKPHVCIPEGGEIRCLFVPTTGS